MLRNWNLIGVACATLVAAGGCLDDESATDLVVDGPPMVRQVRMAEKFTDGTSSVLRTRRVFGFGTHPLAADEDFTAGRGAIQSADATDNSLRIVMDELLVGNNLERVVCRAPVNTDGSLSQVPLGSTPDDIARCSLPNDALVDSCKSGPKAICICEIDAGCPRVDELGVVATVAVGDPVGILDTNLDGAADKTQMIPGAVAIKCGDIDVPINLDASYWNPSGNQTVPAMGGFDALGPAIVLAPKLLPTNLQCRIAFADSVVDKQNISICAPVDGDVTKGCTPGDTTAFAFKSEPLAFTPAPPFMNGQTGTSRTNPISFDINVPIDPATIAGITITPAAPIEVTLAAMNTALEIAPTAPTGFAPNTTYTITIPVSVKDTFGQPAPAPTVITFTTAS